MGRSAEGLGGNSVANLVSTDDSHVGPDRSANNSLCPIDFDLDFDLIPPSRDSGQPLNPCIHAAFRHPDTGDIAAEQMRSSIEVRCLIYIDPIAGHGAQKSAAAHEGVSISE